ncbi:hypothetical protein J6590_036813 [Homalodisca vitripennis]|nr:hypothetical protein J6590_036813 [Homalodisca vitripennis]
MLRETVIRSAVMIVEVVLEEAESTKFLRLILDRFLTWNNQSDQVYSRVTSGLCALRHIA